MGFYLNTEIPQKKTLYKALQEIFGIGNTLSLKICKLNGINPLTTLNHLPKKKIQKLFFFIETNYLINEELKKKNQQILTNLKIIKNKK